MKYRGPGKKIERASCSDMMRSLQTMHVNNKHRRKERSEDDNIRKNRNKRKERTGNLLALFRIFRKGK